MKNVKKSKVVNRISFEYIKGNFFRVIHADGIQGGLSPSLDIHMAFYSERQPIPQEVVHFVTGDGILGEEDLPARKARKGMIREVDADVILDLTVARALARWLQDKIDQADEIIKQKAVKTTKLKQNNLKATR